MPKIPALTNTTVQHRPAPSTRMASVATPELLAAEAKQQSRLAKAIMAVGGTLGDLALAMKKEEDGAYLADQEAGFRNETRDFLHAPDNGYLNLQGKEAYDSYHGAKEHIDKMQKDRIAKAPPHLQPVLKKSLERAAGSAFDTAARHASHERRRYLDNASASRINALRADAVVGFNDRAKVYGSLADAEMELRAAGGRHGWDHDTMEYKLAELRTEVHSGVIKRTAEASPLAARGYYKEHADEILGTKRADLEKMLDAATLREVAQRQTDTLIAQDLTEEQALMEARKIDDANVRDEVVRRLTNRYTERENALKEDRLAASDAAYKILAEGGTYDSIPPSLLNRMDGKTQLAFKATAETQEGGADYWRLKEMAELNPREFAEYNLYSDFDKLAKSERKALFTDWVAARKGPDPEKVAAGRTKWQIIQQGAADAGLDPKDANKDSSSGNRVRQFYQRVDDELAAWQQETGKAPGPREVVDTVRRLAIKVTEEQSFLTFDYLNPDDETPAGRLDIEGVPTEIIDELAYGVQSAGQPVTVDNIRKLYEYRYGR